MQILGLFKFANPFEVIFIEWLSRAVCRGGVYGKCTKISNKGVIHGNEEYTLNDPPLYIEHFGMESLARGEKHLEVLDRDVSAGSRTKFHDISLRGLKYSSE